MPTDKYIEVIIGDLRVETKDPDALNVSIDYKLEDEQNFQQKRGSESIGLTVPATLVNSITAGSAHDPSVEDLTDGKIFDGFQSAVIRAGGEELLVGKAFLNDATHTDRPEEYSFDLFADNTDWKIALAETTFYELLQHINFTFNKQLVIDSWQFNGRSEALPYVFAPVRYGQPMASHFLNVVQTPPPTVIDYNMEVTYMRPSMSVYWLLHWGFKLAGYKISSEFYDTDFFRRRTLPWCWGNFLFSDGTRLNNLDFLAKSVNNVVIDYTVHEYVDVQASNDKTNGAFDNNDSYDYNASAREMRWTYKTDFNYGNLDATFHLATFIDAYVNKNSDCHLYARWYKNNVQQGTQDTIVSLDAPAIGNRTFVGVVDISKTINVNPGDRVTCKLWLDTFNSGVGRVSILINIETLELDYFRIPLGGIIDFKNYNGFKKIKFLDFLRGEIDLFDLQIKTDNVNKVVYLEPSHEYTLPGETTPRKGFFNGDFIDWSRKQDLSIKSRLQKFRDYERELVFKMKADSNDGMQKIIQDRNVNLPAAAKYVLPARFKAGKKDHENRFYSPVIHYDVDQWKDITGTAPQMILMVPENISNTSRSEAENTFLPKAAYYKGVVPGMGWIFDGVKQTSFPFMFAVNYKPGGQADPVLSYSDEKIGNDNTGYVIAAGLLNRFFLQRMAIMRNGQWYNTWMRLNNYDVSNQLHREYKVLKGQRWECVQINSYQPLRDQSTAVLLRKHSPVIMADGEACFPSADSIMNNVVAAGFDMRYSRLKCLPSDIPRPA